MQKSPENPADQALIQGIVERLDNEPKLDTQHIKVEIHEGHVTLKGKADTEEEKALAEEITRACPGVMDVKNELHVDVGVAHGLTSFITQITSGVDEKKGEK